MSLGKNIQNLRKQNQMTQSELAEKLLVSRQAVSKWESDFNEPDIKTLIALSDIFQVTVDELIKDKNTQEDIDNIGYDNDMVINEEITSEILKTNKKNHRLLVFIVGIIVCVLIIFAICFLLSNANEPTLLQGEEMTLAQNISKQTSLDHKYIQSLGFDIQLTDYQNQKMKFQGELKTYLPMQEGTLTVIYKDQKTEKLEIYPTFQDDTSYAFQKEIDAKTIETIIVEINHQKIEYSQIACPIENYMYELDFQPTIKSQSQNSFQMNLSTKFLQEEQMYNEVQPFRFEDVILLTNNDENLSSSYIERVIPINIDIKKNDQIIKKKTITQESQMEEAISIEEQYNPTAKYSIEISYQTPLKQTLKWKYDITKDDFMNDDEKY